MSERSEENADMQLHDNGGTKRYFIVSCVSGAQQRWSAVALKQGVLEIQQ